MRNQPVVSPSRYEDCKLVEKEGELRDFLCWPMDDVVVATVDSILQVQSSFGMVI